MPAKKIKSKSIVTSHSRSSSGIRLRKLSRRQRVKKEKLSQRSAPIANSWVLIGRSIRHIYRNKKLFLGILLTYGLLYTLFVKGISANFQLGSLRQNLESTFNGKLSGLGTGVALYGLLLGSAGSSTSDSGATYQTVLVIIVSLALIWALRHSYAGETKLRIRDSFYKGMYPLVPFLLVAGVIFIQTLPALIVGSLFSITQNNGLTVGPIQQLIAIIVLFSGLLWTFYMISSSLLALYIVTLADETPIKALKEAKRLVRYRRWLVLRKVLFLPIILLLLSAVILIPLIIIFAPAAEIVFMLFTILLLGVIHSYLYGLYRSLL